LDLTGKCILRQEIFYTIREDSSRVERERQGIDKSEVKHKYADNVWNKGIIKFVWILEESV